MTEPESNAPLATANRIKLVVLVVLAIVVVTLAVLLRHELTIESLAQREAQFRSYQQQHPVLIYGIAFAVYVTLTGLSVPWAAGLTLLYGWLFGFWHALILVSFASTTGATVAFLLSRYLLRDTVESKFGERLSGFNRALQDEGAFYLFTLRLIPAVPYVVINLVMGLTPLAVGTFWWVSQLGMLPGTAVFVYAGASVPSAEQLAERGVSGILSPQLIVAFVLLGFFPLAVKKIMGAIKKRPPEDV